MRRDFSGKVGRCSLEDDDDLPANVQTGIIVDTELSVADPATRENERGIDVPLPRSQAGPDGEMLRSRQRNGPPAEDQRGRRCGRMGGAAERDLLVPSAGRAAGLQSDRPELRGDVSGADFVTF